MTTSRISLPKAARAVYRAIDALDSSAEFEPRLRELVRIRASQINGCAFCVDMHSVDAREAGEHDRRIYALAAWHEGPFFDERERAALALTEAMTACRKAASATRCTSAPPRHSARRNSATSWA